MPFPTIAALEELVPELARLANTPKSNQTQIDNFATLLQNAGRLWTIERSLYDSYSDFFVEIAVNNLSNFLNDGISTIAELLISKINGEQRFFIQAEYVVSENIQDLAADWADNLREIWKQDFISPIQIKYRSASQNTINSYIVYPVALHYYQRAYYLYAVGETPAQTNSQTFQWYSYRLERILFLKELTWNFSDTTKLLKAQIYPGDRVNYCYTPTYIQEQLELAYGLSFYRQANTMLLRFDRDYYQRQIKDTIRHSTFEKIADLTEVKNFIIQQLKSETDRGNKYRQEKLLAKVERACGDAYHKLRYRVDDNDAIVRLRSWGSNVEVILPWDLRAQMKQELEQACNFYRL